MKKRDIEILRVLHLRGPNIWTYRPVLEAWVDIGELEDAPSNTIPGFYERLSSWLPSLVEHRCSYGERGGFLRRLQEGTWPAHILEHVTLELQNLAGMPGGFGKARETSTRGVYKVVVRAWHDKVTRDALAAARDLVMAAIEDRPFDVAATVERLRDGVDAYCLGPSTACIVDAADDRDIPAIRLSQGNLVQLGLRREAAPHLDRGDRPHQRDRREHLPRQGPDQAPARSPAACRCRRGAWWKAPRTPGRRPRRSGFRSW